MNNIKSDMVNFPFAPVTMKLNGMSFCSQNIMNWWLWHSWWWSFQLQRKW